MGLSDAELILITVVLCYVIFVFIVITLIYLLCCKKPRQFYYWQVAPTRLHVVPMQRQHIIHNPIYEAHYSPTTNRL